MIVVCTPSTWSSFAAVTVTVRGVSQLAVVKVRGEEATVTPVEVFWEVMVMTTFAVGWLVKTIV